MPDVKKNTVSVELTVSQCHALKGFVEIELMPAIRADSDADNFEWLSDMIDAHHALAKAVTDHAEKS